MHAVPPPSGVPAFSGAHRAQHASSPGRSSDFGHYGTYTHPAVEAWFTEDPRYYRHFTPTGASWLNLVERFFPEITDKRTPWNLLQRSAN